MTHLPGIEMPSLIYGTAWKKDRTADLVTKAVKYGFRGIDTACQPKHYNEPGVGEAIQRLADEGIPRKELYIQTKFTPIDGQDPHNVPYDKRAPLNEQVAQSFEASKRNLGVNFVDGLILHSPLNNFEKTMLVWQAMEEIYHQSGALRIGISNCYDLEILKQIYEASTVKPSIVQNRFYQDTDYDYDIREWCRKQEIVYQSFWTLSANPQILHSEIVQETARTFQKTAEQILFRVVIDLGIVPLTGTSSDKHMKEDLEVLNFDLPPATVQNIASLFKL